MMSNLSTEDSTLGFHGHGGNHTQIERVILVTILSSLSLLGCLGNLVVIAAIFWTPKLWTVPNLYVLNLAVADFVICSVLLPFESAAMMIGHTITGCGIMGLLTTGNIVVTLLSLVAIAVNRYLLVRLTPDKYNTLYTTGRMVISLIIIWSIGVLVIIPALFKLIQPGYYEKLRMCVSVTTDGGATYAYIIMAFIVVPSMSIVSVCYYQIWRIFKTSIQNLEANQPRHRSASKKYQVTKNLLIVTIVFVFSWIPETMMGFFSFGTDIPAGVLQFTYMLALSNSVVNPYLYAGLNRQFLEAYKQVLKCGCFCQKPVCTKPIGSISGDTTLA